jgi:uncharacterized protein
VNNIEEVRRLIDAGVKVDETTSSNKTALKIAIKHDYLEIAKLLIRGGADVNKTSNSGGTALMLAASNGRIKMVRLLIDSGADVGFRSRSKGRAMPSQTALSLAQSRGHHNIVQILKANNPHP